MSHAAQTWKNVCFSEELIAKNETGIVDFASMKTAIRRRSDTLFLRRFRFSFFHSFIMYTRSSDYVPLFNIMIDMRS